MRALILVGLLLILPIAVNAETLNYLGEGVPAHPTYTSYTGSNAGSSRWDYVYSIGGWSADTLTWAVVCPVTPVAHWQSSGWSYTYYNSIPWLGEKLAEVQGKPGIVWAYTDGADAPDYFHFQTDIAGPGIPTLQTYDGDGWTGGKTTSANPEPGSIALLCLAVGAGTMWRRRRASRK